VTAVTTSYCYGTCTNIRLSGIVSLMISGMKTIWNPWSLLHIYLKSRWPKWKSYLVFKTSLMEERVFATSRERVEREITWCDDGIRSSSFSTALNIQEWPSCHKMFPTHFTISQYLSSWAPSTHIENALIELVALILMIVIVVSFGTL
jgi:uncharacterized membrane protein